MTKAAVYIETYGCSFNVADEEAMAGVLGRAGYQVVRDSAEADVIVLNTCTVKDRTYRDFETRFKKLKKDAEQKAGPRLVLAGCIPKVHDRSDLFKDVAAIGPDTLAQVDMVVGEVLAGKNTQCIRAENIEAGPSRPLLPIQRRNPSVEIIPISSGCLSACSFCQTRLARGRLRSFRPGDIVQRARRALSEGVKEIWLTSQDTGAYGKDCDYPLPKLLHQLCELEGDFRIRLGMSSPIWIWDDLEAYLRACEHPKMFRFLHVPLQSGSDRVLREMKRGNTAGQFIEISRAFHTRFPDGALLTDIIVGFPTETDEDFAATLSVLEQSRPAAVNRSKFSPRPGTSAAQMKPLPSRAVTERSLRATETVRRLARAWNERWIGRRGLVLTTEHKKNNTTLANNEAWRPVILPGRVPLGRWIDVNYVQNRDFHLRARVVDQ